jgi:outer membrane receptor protein involved in Fe transport
MRYAKNQAAKRKKQDLKTKWHLLFGFCLLTSTSSVEPLFAAMPLPTVFSQSPTRGAVVGKIIDAATKDPLPGVNVLVQGTAHGAVTDLEGNYRIPELSAGAYTMTASMIGYTKVQRTGVKVVAGAAVTINFELQVTTLAIGQEVVVIGEKPLFQIDETSSRRAVTAKDLASSTLESVQEVVANQVGVVQSNNEIHIRGGRAYENAFLVDGVSVQDPLAGTGFGLHLSTDAIEEIEVITGGINAEFGQAMSGVVNVVTKDGQRDFRGSVSYKRDHFGSYRADKWPTRLISHFSRQNSHSFETDIVEASFSGREPLLEVLLPALGVKAPGEFTFFSSGYLFFSNDFTKTHANQLSSSVFHGTRFAPRQNNLLTGLYKLVWRIDPTHKLSLSLNGSAGINQNTQTLQTNLEYVEPAPGFPYDFSKNLDEFNTFTHLNNKTSLGWTHTLGPTAFYEIRLSRYFANLRSDLDGKDWTEYIEPKQIPDLPLSYYRLPDGTLIILPEGFYTAGNDFTWHDHFVEDWSLRADLTKSTRNGRHFIKTGLEATYRTMQLIDIYSPWVAGGFGLNNDIYRVHPNFGAVYVQDKITFEGLIANIGLRFDYWFPGEYVDEAVNNPEVVTISEATRQQYRQDTYKLFGHRWKGRLAPRLGISHPVSDNQVLFFSYGHFSKLPKPQFVYAKLGPNAAKSSYQKFGNPNLNPETTVAYELGLKSQLSENDVLTVTAYYKDIFDYVNTVTFRGNTGRTAGRTFITYLNLDYARARGIEVEYKKRLGRNFSAAVSGAYSFATGKSSSPDDGLLLAQGYLNERPITEEFLPWDRPWQINMNVNLTVPKGQRPKIFGVRLPDDWNLYGRLFAQAGKRYSPQYLIGIASDGKPLYSGDLDQDGDLDDPYGKLASTWRWVDVNFEKYFRFGRTQLVFMIEALNMLNWKNTNIVNPVTGRAYEENDPVPSSWNDPRYPDLQAPAEPFPFDPARYLAPRNIRLGLAFKF